MTMSDNQCQFKHNPDHSFCAICKEKLVTIKTSDYEQLKQENERLKEALIAVKKTDILNKIDTGSFYFSDEMRYKIQTALDHNQGDDKNKYRDFIEGVKNRDKTNAESDK
jgi:uncharacterized Zn finger protein (UPF0148 family)